MQVSGQQKCITARLDEIVAVGREFTSKDHRAMFKRMLDPEWMDKIILEAFITKGVFQSMSAPDRPAHDLLFDNPELFRRFGFVPHEAKYAIIAGVRETMREMKCGLAAIDVPWSLTTKRTMRVRCSRDPLGNQKPTDEMINGPLYLFL